MKNQINVQHIKNYFSKPSILVLAITMAISELLSAIISIATYNEVYKALETFISFISAESSQNFSINDFMDTNTIRSIISTITSIIFSLVPICVWLWIYFSSKSKDINKTPDTPLLINMVFSILGIASSGLCVFILGIFTVIFFPMSLVDFQFDTQQEQNLFSSMFFFLIILFSILTVISIIQLLYYIGKTMFFNSARKCMTRDRIKPTGKLYGTFAFIGAFLYIVIGALIIIFGISLLSNDGYVNLNTDFSLNDIISFLSYFDGISILILLTGTAFIISAVPLLIEGKIAFNFYKMARAVPPTPNYSPYNNYNNYNSYNSNPYYQNNNYNNTNYTNPNYNKPGFNQGYINPQEQHQPIPQEHQPKPNDYLDNFNNSINDNDLNVNPYENK